MSNEQREALAKRVPTTEVIRDAVTFPRDRLGEPLDISAERFDAWLNIVKAQAIRDVATGFIDWEVVYGHEEATPETEASHATADYLNDCADRIEKGE